MIDEPAARAVAAEAYRHLSELTGETLPGGGPDFAIDARRGEITARRYER